MISRPAPYGADVRAKGWRFELDYERIEQSDTWSLAAQALKPWLLMLWFEAWRLTPAGSLPGDDLLIAARIGMPHDQFMTNKQVLLRGWWRADDGRLYHDTLVERVLEMQKSREKDRLRKAGYRAKGKDSVPRDNNGTPVGIEEESSGVRVPEPEPEPEPVISITPTQLQSRARVCVVGFEKHGFKISADHAKLLGLVNAGATPDMCEEAAQIASSKRKTLAYVFGVIERKLQSPASTPLASPQQVAYAVPNAEETALNTKEHQRAPRPVPNDIAQKFAELRKDLLKNTRIRMEK